MLSPTDILSAKLLIQLQDSNEHLIRNLCRQLDRDPDPSMDLVARLTERGVLQPAQVKRVRRYQAMFEHVRREAIYLRLVEELYPEMPKDVIGDLIARIERDTYRRRLGAVLVDMGKLTVEQAIALEKKTRVLVQKEDLKILERYRRQDFDGVSRPLIKASVVSTQAFKVSTLFRSRDTRMHVERALLRLDEAERIGVAQHEFVPIDPPTTEVELEEELDEESKAEIRKLETARFRAEPEPPEEVGLDQIEAIGSYQVVEILGQGGMGAVYLAQEDGFGPMVAVKVTLAEQADPDDLARFRREAEFTGLMDHPNVVRLMDEGQTEGGLLYMVIPFYAGRDLRAILKDAGGILEPTLVFDFFEKILEGLAEVHSHKIVHRDLKPENVFVLAGSDREVRLVDLGIARMMDDDQPVENRAFRSKAGIISGSPAYIAPEVITSDPIDPRTDIYSLGTMIYQLFTGRLPLYAESNYDFLREHLVGVPLTLFQGKKDTYWGEGIEELMASMLAKEKADRPESCNAILHRLREGRLKEETLELMANPPEEDEDTKSSGLFNTFFKMFR